MSNFKYLQFKDIPFKTKGKILEDYIGLGMKVGDIVKKYNMSVQTFNYVLDEYWGNGTPVFMNIDVSDTVKKKMKRR
jgi:hypothetical protein